LIGPLTKHAGTNTVLQRAALRSRDGTLMRHVGLARAGSGVDSHLTRRELEVLRLMADGLSNAEIARRLVVSTSTAKVHVHHILRKLDARSRLEAVLSAQHLLDS
jgi:DNA-binding NarL/FixJ family response regulator